MSITLGIDPGFKGAFALYDNSAKRILWVEDMPILTMVINRQKRTRTDIHRLLELVRAARAFDCQLTVIEKVGGRGKQSASAGFEFGYNCGLIAMACVSVGIPVEYVTPQVWKKALRVPGKDPTKAERTAGKALTETEYNNIIVHHALNLMPDMAGKFNGPQGGAKADRAEACMIAKYAGDIMMLGK